jgi:nucleoside-diphosphate-sugar epimerase
MAAGYSGTPLAKKLGITQGRTVVAIGAPRNYKTLLAPLPPKVRFVTRDDGSADIVHLFVTERRELAERLARLVTTIQPTAAVWVSWPKKASGVATTVTEDVIREIALPLGFVDVKVCAVDERWSGLKLVIRKAVRTRSR